MSPRPACTCVSWTTAHQHDPSCPRAPWPDGVPPAPVYTSRAHTPDMRLAREWNRASCRTADDPRDPDVPHAPHIWSLGGHVWWYCDGYDAPRVELTDGAHVPAADE